MEPRALPGWVAGALGLGQGEIQGAESRQGASEKQLLSGARVTSGVEGFESHVQGDAREAECEAQPVQEADLIPQ